MADEEDLRRVHAGEVDLSRSDLRHAELSGLDLRGRNLSGARLEFSKAIGTDFRGCNFVDTSIAGADFSRANLSGVRVNVPTVSVNLSGANLTGAIFDNVRFTRVDFTGADLRSTSFKNAHFAEDILLDGAIIDDITEFEGAESLRYMARHPALMYFVYENGRFKRKDASSPSQDSERQAESVNLDAPTVGSTTILHTPDIAQVQSRIAASPAEAKVMAANLAIAVQGHIDLVSASKPNEPASLARFEEQVSFLQHLAEGLSAIALALEEERTASIPEAKSRSINRAARIVSDLSESVEIWMKEHGRSLIGHTVNIGLIGAASAFFGYCGAPALVGFGTAAALIGGKPLVDAAKGFLGGSTDDKK